MIKSSLVLLVCVGVPVALLFIGSALVRWYTGRHDPVDALIRQKGAKVCTDKNGQPRWTRADPELIAAAGAARWRTVWLAQLRWTSNASGLRSSSLPDPTDADAAPSDHPMIN